jgi:hypothetical protein
VHEVNVRRPLGRGCKEPAIAIAGVRTRSLAHSQGGAGDDQRRPRAWHHPARSQRTLQHSEAGARPLSRVRCRQQHGASEHLEPQIPAAEGRGSGRLHPLFGDARTRLGVSRLLLDHPGGSQEGSCWGCVCCGVAVYMLSCALHARCIAHAIRVWYVTRCQVCIMRGVLQVVYVNLHQTAHHQ